MGVLSDYAVNKMFDHVLKVGEYSTGDIYIALFDDDPNDGGVECTGTGYTRIKCNDWENASGRMTANTNKIDFPEAVSDWGTIKYIVVIDGNDNILAYTDIITYTVQDGDSLYIIEEDIEAKLKTGGVCNTTANRMIDHIFKVQTFTVPTNLYVGASKAKVEDDASGLTEPSGNNYARKLHNNWNPASGKASKSDGKITFAPSSGSWGTVTHGFVSDNISSTSESNILFHGVLNIATTIGNGDTLEFADKGFMVRMDV